MNTEERPGRRSGCVAFGGCRTAATIVGLFFLLGVLAAPFLPETGGKPLPHALWLQDAEATGGPTASAAN